MNTTELIEIARECKGVVIEQDNVYQADAGEIHFFCADDLQQFAQRIQPQWQPIETAPKDGTRIMLWEQYSDVPFVGWWMAGGHWTVSHEHVDAKGGWEGAIVVDRIEQKFITHWMPLPTPQESKP